MVIYRPSTGVAQLAPGYGLLSLIIIRKTSNIVYSVFNHVANIDANLLFEQRESLYTGEEINSHRIGLVKLSEA